MTHLQPRPHVSFAFVGGRPVFLDVRRDRYFAFGDGMAATFVRVVEDGGKAPEDRAAREGLLATKLFEKSDSAKGFAPTAVAVPARTAELARGPGRPLDLLGIYVRLAAAHRAVRTQPLEGVLARHSKRSSSLGATRDAGETASLAGRFERARSLVPVRRTCLPDSLALAGWLARRGARASIVFGVKLDPFAAHCWVQTEVAVLNDAPDRVSSFTPILILP